MKIETIGLFCAHPHCTRTLTIPTTGRTPKYCSEEHRKNAYQLRQRAQHVEAQRQAAERRADEEHRALVALGVQLVIAIRNAGVAGEGPGAAAMAITEWIERSPSRLQSRHEAVWQLATFVAARSGRPAGDERPGLPGLQP